MHHTDRASQYTGDAYQTALARHRIRCSMSRKGDCWDNAVAESFFATLHPEPVQGRTFPSLEASRREVGDTSTSSTTPRAYTAPTTTAAR